MDFITRSAQISDLSYIDHLQRRNAEELAFYPKVVFERDKMSYGEMFAGEARVCSGPAWQE